MVPFISPSDYVYTVGVEAGEREVDFKYGRAALRPGDDQKAATSVGLGLGVNEAWFTEVYAKWEQSLQEGQHFDAVEWENRFVLTERGALPFELGLVTEVERPKDRSEGYELKLGPLFQTRFARWQLNANVLLTRSVRADQDIPPQLGYQLQLKYRLGPTFEPGVQVFGQMGDASHWSPVTEQSHRAGPAFFGSVPVGTQQRLRYNAAWLRGLSEGAPRDTFRVQVELEF